ncbi:50S ribosomal protein L17 [Candidatus Daviesbacteria bacterium]|nr:50S ribosomal protein L17 [Candidatus Daviesbacteria bacterium]
MRHRVYGKHLGRNKDARRNLFKGLVYSLVTSGTIQTSETKAKAIKGLVDKIINLAKEKNIHGLQSYISDKSLQERLINEILPKLGTRTSGYTSMVKVGTRLGDQTRVIKMSIIGAEELKPIKKEVPKTEKAAEPKEVKEVKKTPVKRKTVKK